MVTFTPSYHSCCNGAQTSLCPKTSSPSSNNQKSTFEQTMVTACYRALTSETDYLKISVPNRKLLRTGPNRKTRYSTGGRSTIWMIGGQFLHFSQANSQSAHFRGSHCWNELHCDEFIEYGHWTARRQQFVPSTKLTGTIQTGKCSLLMNAIKQAAPVHCLISLPIHRGDLQACEWFGILLRTFRWNYYSGLFSLTGVSVTSYPAKWKLVLTSTRPVAILTSLPMVVKLLVKNNVQLVGR